MDAAQAVAIMALAPQAGRDAREGSTGAIPAATDVVALARGAATLALIVPLVGVTHRIAETADTVRIRQIAVLIRAAPQIAPIVLVHQAMESVRVMGVLTLHALTGPTVSANPDAILRVALGNPALVAETLVPQIAPAMAQVARVLLRAEGILLVLLGILQGRGNVLTVLVKTAMELGVSPATVSVAAMEGPLIVLAPTEVIAPTRVILVRVNIVMIVRRVRTGLLVKVSGHRVRLVRVAQTTDVPLVRVVPMGTVGLRVGVPMVIGPAHRKVVVAPSAGSMVTARVAMTALMVTVLVVTVRIARAEMGMTDLANSAMIVPEEMGTTVPAIVTRAPMVIARAAMMTVRTEMGMTVRVVMTVLVAMATVSSENLTAQGEMIVLVIVTIDLRGSVRTTKNELFLPVLRSPKMSQRPLSSLRARRYRAESELN